MRELTKNSGEASNCTDIDKITAFGSFEPIEISPMPRNHYAYTYFHNGIEAVSFQAATADPDARIYISGQLLKPGQRTENFPLKNGRNLFDITVVAPDQVTTRKCNLKIFRAYSTPVWEQVLEQAPWTPRDSAGEIVFKDKMWLIGGYIPELTNDVWSSSDGSNWTWIGTVPTSYGVDIPVLFIFEDKMFVIDVAGVMYASPDGSSWELVTDQAPWTGRRQMGGAVFNDKMWVMGGVKDNQVYNDVWSSEDGVTWVLEVEHAPWSKRQISHNLLNYKGKLWLLGGGVMGSSYFPFVAYNDVWSTSDGIHWERATAHAPWPARIWGSTVVYKNKMWMIGGYRAEPESRHFGDVWYSTDGIEWTALEQHALCWKRSSGNVPISIPAPMWQDRHEASALVLHDTLFLMGGMIWPLKNDVWRLKIDGLSFLSQPNFEGYVDCLYIYKAFADFSQSLNKIKYRLVVAPEWLSINEDNGYISGVPPHVAQETVLVEAYDESGETAQQKYELFILPLN
ncbi:cadherin-like beta sandwich domain-containing protein [Paenibacillus koleovorans]|uniref:cadherin-like beta sandwich domain-containing protein n=1 Tax=Paenibacillus koleovorans TaxID=121608 RepID=UPI001FE93185|nr:cadherin-like beta sandwich domain-containing protein [Paenibacillus koleovorans]